MSIEYQNESPNWSATGTEPPDTLKTNGFEAGYKPPANYFNWFWNTVSKCISELQNNAAGKTVKVPDTNFYGEIFNDYINNKATGDYSHAEGIANTASGKAAHAEGAAHTASGQYSHAEGHSNTASGECSHVEGEANTASGESAHAEGANNNAPGDYSHVGGYGSWCRGSMAFAHGKEVEASTLNFCIGKYNKFPTYAAEDTNTGDLFVIGSGLRDGAKSNAFRVTAAGAVMGTQAYTATGADFAEAFEWIDGNPNNEDRRGLFVTLDGEKIKLATKNDYIAGVVSAAPTVVGDAHTDDWQGKYVTDVFGARVLENEAWKLSDGFDKAKDDNYTSRLERPEWSAVGLVGKLVVVDDGTCQVNGYCYPSEKGIATAAESGYRVMARIDKNHVRVLLK